MPDHSDDSPLSLSTRGNGPPDPREWSERSRAAWGRTFTGAQLTAQNINAGPVPILDTTADLAEVFAQADASWTLQYQLANQGAGVIAGSPVFLQVTQVVGEAIIVSPLLAMRAATRRYPLQSRRVKVMASRVPTPPLAADSVFNIGVSLAPMTERHAAPLGLQFLLASTADPTVPTQVATLTNQCTIRRVYGGAIAATAASVEVPAWFLLFDSNGAPAANASPPLVSVRTTELAPGVDVDADFFAGLWGCISADPNRFVQLPAGYTGSAAINIDGWVGP